MVGQAAFATQDIGGLAEQATGSFAGIGKLLMAICYVCGFGLATISVFMFKKHRDNPQQTALGVPVGLLVIGVGLIFLPTLLGTAGQTIFGTDRQASDYSGSGYDVKLGGSTTS